MEEELEEHTCEFCDITSTEVFRVIDPLALRLDIDSDFIYICPNCYEERIFEV